jgi:Tol biopolymer transport system component
MMFVFSGFAQFPGFEIYIMSTPTDTTETDWILNISKNPGYDNQPSFGPDGSYVLFSSVRDSVQSDIYKFEVYERVLTQITNTVESEYSPEITPDQKHFSVVRVERDSTQRFCVYPLAGVAPELLLKDVSLIGYYGRINASKLAMFLLPEPFYLEVADLESEVRTVIDSSIGRCIRKIPGEDALSYIKKLSDTHWSIQKADLTNPIGIRVSEITRISPTAEDYAWSPDGSKLWMAHGSQLFYFDYRGDGTWHPSENLADFGIAEIFRIACSPDGKHIAFVASEE